MNITGEVFSMTGEKYTYKYKKTTNKHMITFIILVTIGWLISFGTVIGGMIVGWRDLDSEVFYDGFKLFAL